YAGAHRPQHGAFYGNAAWPCSYYHGCYHYGGYGYANAYNRTADFNRTTDFNRTVTRTTSFNSSAWAHDAGAFHADGWTTRATSMRGWGSMRAGGFSGGR